MLGTNSLRSARGRTLVFAILAFIVGALRYAPVVDEPWDESVASTNSACYTGRIIRSWQDVGFEKMRGETCLIYVPSDPPRKLVYKNHPPFYPWLIYATVSLTSNDERGFRLLPIFFAAGIAALLVLLGAQIRSPGFGLLAAGVYLITPMGFYYGWMVNPESGVLFAILMTFLLHLRLREGSLRNWSLVVLAFLFGSFLDWQAFFVAPALWLYELLQPKSSRQFRRSLLLFPAGVLSFVLTLAIYSYWAGSWSETLQRLGDMAGNAASGQRQGELTLLGFFRNQARFWSELYGIPLALAAVSAVVLLIRRLGGADENRRSATAILSLFAPALINVVLFHEHAYDHDFWWYLALPFLSLGTAEVLRAVASRSRILAALFALVLIVEAARGHHEFRETNLPEPGARNHAQVNALVGRDEILIRADYFGPECFYLKAWLADGILDPEYLRELATLIRKGELPFRRAVYLFPEHLAARHPETATALPEIGQVRQLGEVRVVVIE